jgi:predicted GNAT family N-acyltransferase
MITIVQFRSSDESLFSLARGIRDEVFIIGQRVPESIEYEFEDESVHYLLLEDGVAKMTARWRETSGGIKLERFAVPEAFRNRGLGTQLLSRILMDVIPFGKPIYLHAQVAAMPYYLRAGFEAVGEMFEEAGIDHYRMEYRPR